MNLIIYHRIHLKLSLKIEKTFEIYLIRFYLLKIKLSTKNICINYNCFFLSDNYCKY